MLNRCCAAIGGVFDRAFGRSKHERIDTSSQDLSDEADRQLLVDVSVIHRHDARTGIQRVVRALLLQLGQSPLEGYAFKPVFATRGHGYSYARPDFLTDPARSLDNHVHVTPSPERVKVRDGDIFLGLDLAANLLPRYRDQVSGWKRHGVRIHILVYDLLPIFEKQWFHRRTRKHFSRWLAFIEAHADGVICISDQVCADVRHAFKLHRSTRRQAIQVSKIRLGSNIQASAPSLGMPQSAKNLLQDLKNQTVILMVGTIEPRKGYDVAIAAFEKIWLRDQNSAPYLVIAGKPGWKTGRLQRRLRRHPAAGEKLIWLSDASDEVIEQLYRISTGVFVTSHGEGYGLPIVEAGFHGKPVLARNLPVFQELAQSGISFFSDDRPAPLADALVKWLGSIARRSPISSPSTPSTSWAEARDDLLLAIGVHATDQRAINAGNSRADQDGSR